MSWCNDWDRDNCDCGCGRDRDRDRDSCCRKIIIKKECCDRERPRCCEKRRRFCFCGIFRCGGRRRGCGCGNSWDGGCDGWNGNGSCGCGW